MPVLTDMRPALELRRALDAGAMFTRLAEDMGGQPVHAEVERLGPVWLQPDELPELGIRTVSESVAALRRAGHLVDADGQRVAKVSSVVAVGRIPADVYRALTMTDIPLGKALGEQVHSLMLESSLGIGEYAVHCRRLVLVAGVPVALATDRVLWAWLDGLPA